MGLTWLKQSDSANLTPMITNTGQPSSTGNSNIELCKIGIDGNQDNQSAGSTKHCVNFFASYNIKVHDFEITECKRRGLTFNGNALYVGPVWVERGYIHDVSEQGLVVSNGQRETYIDDIQIENTVAAGFFADASQGTWSNIRVRAAGLGATCSNAGARTVVNPGGGGASQWAWNPCPPGIYFHNLTSCTATNLTAEQGFFYGILVIGTRDCTLSNLVATNNSLDTLGTWNDLQFDLTDTQSGYGENHNIALVGAVLGRNYQDNTTSQSVFQAPTAGYGLYIADGLAGSLGDATLVNAGTGYTVNDTLSCSGGTSTQVCQARVAAVSGGIITQLQRYAQNGSGFYTIFPANPVALTGGTGASATMSVTWSTARLTGLVFGDTVTAHARYPAMMANWYVSSNDGNVGGSIGQYIASRYYSPGFTGTAATGTAYNNSLDTVVVLYPFTPKAGATLSAQGLNVRTVSLGASCALKLAVWASNASTFRPTGTPIAGSNSGQACTGNNTTQTVAITYTFTAGVTYWFAVAVSTAAPSFLSMLNVSNSFGDNLGRTSLASSTIGVVSAPYTYATDIMTLDLTGATFTEVSPVGVPIQFLQCAAVC